MCICAFVYHKSIKQFFHDTTHSFKITEKPPLMKAQARTNKNYDSEKLRFTQQTNKLHLKKQTNGENRVEIENETVYSKLTTNAEMHEHFDNNQHIEEPKRSHRFSVEESDGTKHIENLTELVLRGKQRIKYHGIDLMALVSCCCIAHQTSLSISLCVAM